MKIKDCSLKRRGEGGRLIRRIVPLRRTEIDMIVAIYSILLTWLHYLILDKYNFIVFSFVNII